MKPLLVFDLDGTLIDSAPDIIKAVNRTLSHYGKPTLDDKTIVAHIGEGLKKLIADLFKEEPLSNKDLSDIETNFLRIYEEEMLGHTQIFPGVETFLESYDGPLAIITNKNERPAKTILRHLRMDRYPWRQVYGADTLSERKPSPLPLQTMMKHVGHTPENTFMIGDGTPDMLSAQRAGVPSIAIGFGYTHIEILKTYKPRAVLNHYSELSTILTRIHQKKEAGTF